MLFKTGILACLEPMPQNEVGSSLRLARGQIRGVVFFGLEAKNLLNHHTKK